MSCYQPYRLTTCTTLFCGRYLCLQIVSSCLLIHLNCTPVGKTRRTAAEHVKGDQLVVIKFTKQSSHPATTVSCFEAMCKQSKVSKKYKTSGVISFLLHHCRKYRACIDYLELLFPRARLQVTRRRFSSNRHCGEVILVPSSEREHGSVGKIYAGIRKTISVCNL